MNPISALDVPLTCPTCGQPVGWQADGTTTSREARALVTCTGCGRSELVIVRLIPVGMLPKDRLSGAQQRRARRERQAA